MNGEATLPATQRAYTLRLTGSTKEDAVWRDWLWRTHEAVNRGAKAFGDWLLTLRGGLDHALADGDPGERQQRRIILALSWLSVESVNGAPSPFIVPQDRDAGGCKDWRTVEALREILRARGLPGEEAESWVNDCQPSLEAAIRSDAVWVNRSQAFDAATEQIGPSLNREEVWDLLERFFGSRDTYLAPVSDASEADGGESGGRAEDEEAKDLVQKAGQWLSNRFGTGQGADFSRMAEVYAAIGTWAAHAPAGMLGSNLVGQLAGDLGQFEPASRDLTGIKRLISGPGYKSATRNLLDAIAKMPAVDADMLAKLVETAAEDRQKCSEKVGGKGHRAWSDHILQAVESACGFTYLGGADGPARHTQFAVMLDHAARRVSQTHSWVKRAEAERRRFEAESRKLHAVPADVCRWLDAFCAARSQTSGAVSSYLIRKRAVTGWAQVVESWAKAECRTEQDRIAAARALQDDPELDKFGDIQLFEALAADDASCVWRVDDRPASQPLLDYVAATDADEKRRRFKVPAYRHPDPLLHPVFCDFGESRWPIAFAVHRAASRQADSEQAVARKREALQRMTKASPRATTDEARARRAAALTDAQQSLAEAERGSAWLQQPRALTMTLWTGSAFHPADLRWQSKRLGHDLALRQPRAENGAVPGTRAERLGRAAAGAADTTPVSVMGLYDLKEWNGRLQAPRAQLRAIARIRDDATLPAEEQARQLSRLIGRIRWLVSFSARLQPQGPWTLLAERLGLRPDPLYWPHAEENKKRQGQAKLILSRLPGLRVLAVDLGHRSAAACAVWETVTQEQVEEACRRAGRPLPTADSLCLHLTHEGRTTIYRRIGAETLATAAHPAPWARLDRQFLIKLQGEETPARLTSPHEIQDVETLEKELGSVALPDRSLRVDELMADIVRTVRLALLRHGRRARIAFCMTTDKQLIAGGREKPLTDEARVDLLAAALAEWHELTTSDRWSDAWARQQWDACLVPLLADQALPVAQGEETSRQRRVRQEEVTSALRPVAEQLGRNPALRMKLHVLWATHWREEDQRWRKRLRWLRNWILPRRKQDAVDTSIRRVGGLSLTRLATIRSLWQVMRAYRMRPEPDDLRKNIPGRGDDHLAQFGQSILDALERLRENRVKQLASRLAAAALGLGRELTARSETRFAACHAIVIENLTNYRPEDKRTRRENRQLMNWSSAKVKKYLAEACQLHGLHLREVPAAYTSRQDARTGAPGIRCEDVPVPEFLKPGGFWHREMLRARAHLDQGAAAVSVYDQMLLDLAARWEKRPEAEWKMTRPLRLPRRGGEVFVSTRMEPYVGSEGRIRFPFAQADLNAAGNIGLRALLDPDWSGRWWYVPCLPAPSHIPLEDRTRGSAAIEPGRTLPTDAGQASQTSAAPTRARSGRRRRAGAQERRAVNLWRDPAPESLIGSTWHATKEYWDNVAITVITQFLRPCNCLTAEAHP